jgi:hypothetical protein
VRVGCRRAQHATVCAATVCAACVQRPALHDVATACALHVCNGLRCTPQEATCTMQRFLQHTAQRGSMPRCAKPLRLLSDGATCNVQRRGLQRPINKPRRRCTIHPCSSRVAAAAHAAAADCANAHAVRVRRRRRSPARACALRALRTGYSSMRYCARYCARGTRVCGTVQGTVPGVLEYAVLCKALCTGYSSMRYYARHCARGTRVWCTIQGTVHGVLHYGVLCTVLSQVARPLQGRMGFKPPSRSSRCKRRNKRTNLGESLKARRTHTHTDTHTNKHTTTNERTLDRLKARRHMRAAAFEMAPACACRGGGLDCAAQ